MAIRILMEHPVRGRMYVSNDKLDEYLEAGFVEISREELADKPAKGASTKPAHEQAIENIARSGSTTGRAGEADAKNTSSAKKK